MLPVAPIRKPDEVKLLQTFKVSSSGFVGNPLALHGALITVQHSTNDKRTRGIPTQIDYFASRIDAVEDDLKVVRHDETDDSSLRSATWRDRCLNRQGVAAHER